MPRPDKSLCAWDDHTRNGISTSSQRARTSDSFLKYSKAKCTYSFSWSEASFSKAAVCCNKADSLRPWARAAVVSSNQKSPVFCHKSWSACLKFLMSDGHSACVKNTRLSADKRLNSFSTASSEVCKRAERPKDERHKAERVSMPIFASPVSRSRSTSSLPWQSTLTQACALVPLNGTPIERLYDKPGISGKTFKSGSKSDSSLSTTAVLPVNCSSLYHLLRYAAAISACPTHCGTPCTTNFWP